MIKPHNTFPVPEFLPHTYGVIYGPLQETDVFLTDFYVFEFYARAIVMCEYQQVNMIQQTKEANKLLNEGFRLIGGIY